MPPARTSARVNTAGVPARPASRQVTICAVRALAAAAASVLLAGGVGLLIWAVTPESGAAGPVIRGAIAALGAGHFLPPSIGGIVVTLPPLLVTVVCVALVASAANRGRRPGIGLPVELLGALVVGLVYGAVLTAVVAALAPAGAENVGRSWAPVLMGIVAALAGVLIRGRRWRQMQRDRAPGWLIIGLRTGPAATLVILGGGAVVVAAGLVLSFGTAIDLSSIAAPSVGDGVGMVLLSLAYLPNAVIAGAGYSTGIGFQIGAGTYSPLGTTGIDLPALPLLAAVPDAGGLSPVGLASAVFPLLAAVLLGRTVVRRLSVRRDRLLAALTGSLIAGILLAGLAVVAGGGVQGSPWAQLGVPAVGVGAVVAGGTAAVSMTIAAVAGWGAVPWVLVPQPAGELAPQDRAPLDDIEPADPSNAELAPRNEGSAPAPEDPSEDPPEVPDAHPH
jgi:hypothetical protein